jgi:hypothetical protein
MKQDVKSVMTKAEDLSKESCCPLEEQSNVGLIVGVAVGATMGIILIGVMIYCLIFRKPNNSELEQTYVEIFAKFKDFDQTRIRADSETSLIKE